MTSEGIAQRDTGGPGVRTAAAIEVPPLGTRIPLQDSHLTVRLVEPEALSEAQQAEIIELLRQAFNGGPGWFRLPVEPIDHLHWKVWDFPYESSFALTEDGDRIIGIGARLSRQWLVQGQHRVARDGTEGAVHPDYQGQRVSSRRTEALEVYNGDTEFTLSFGSHPTSLARRAKRGTRDFGQPLDNLVRPLNLGRYLRGSARSAPPPTASRTRIAMEGGSRRVPRPPLARRAAWQARMLRHRLRHRPLRFGAGRWTIRTVPRFDDRVEEFFREAAAPFDLIQVRTEEFLNWRYADRRAGPFTIRVAEEDGRLVGYAVVRATEATAELADLLALPGRLDVANALVQDALAQAREARAPSVRAWMMQRHPYHALLAHAGFMPIRRIVRPGFRARAIDPAEVEFLADPSASIHLMLGDTDHV